MTVGLLGFGVQIAAFAALTSRARWSWLAATVFAVELAVLHNFVWHERWTWRDRPAGAVDDMAGRIRRLARFNITTGATSITGNAILMALFVGALGLPAVPGNMLAVAAMSALNFIVSDVWVFQSRTARYAEPRSEPQIARKAAWCR